MAIERWGAFSVLDHRNAGLLATEVLLYDRLLIPTPMDWDRQRWIDEGWDPDGLRARLEQLGDLAIAAAWDLDRQKDWRERFEQLQADQQDINSALEITRRVLVDQNRRYRPPDVHAVEVFSAYQSEADFRELEPDAVPGAETSELNFLIATRLAVPGEGPVAQRSGKAGEAALRQALTLVVDPEFQVRRRGLHEWQHGVLSRGQLPEDAADELVRLVAAYNETVANSGPHHVDAVVLVGSLALGALGLTAGVVPETFAALGVGALAGAKVASIGAWSAGAVMQVASHVLRKAEREQTSAQATENVTGAMFHQIQGETEWRLRATA